jgi:hypothetical protein
VDREGWQLVSKGSPTLLDQSVREVELQPKQAVSTELVAVPDMAAMLERLASNPAVDVAKLEKLIAMQERVLAREAEAAFNAAFAVMQGEIPTVVERAKTDKTTYAPLEDIIEVVRPILKQHGFSLSFQTEWPEANKVKVIGILTHAQGHARRSEFIAGADTSGSKNAIQALGSSVQYGRRYSTKDLLCIVTRDLDDDGEKAGLIVSRSDKPPRFDDWWTDMQSVASDGVDALKKAWKDSPADLRRYVSRNLSREWESMKARSGGGQ